MSAYRPPPHDAAVQHVTGKARYVDDIPMPASTLHLAFGLSRIARGRVKSLDLGPVGKADGVVKVLRAEDLPGANDVSPAAHDEPLLSGGEIAYFGQPVFLVAAESHVKARKAAALALAEWEEERPVIGMDDAIREGSQLEEPLEHRKGDPEKRVAEARRQIKGEIDIGGQEHFYLEGQAALALPQENGDMVVHCSSQHPTEIQHKVAEALGRPMSAVRVEVRRMGGGFGGKESQGNAPAVACAVMASLTGRPCKMRYDRDDDMTITGKRHDFRIRYRAGFDESGRVQGVVLEHFVRCGWSQDLSLPVADRAMLHSDNAYDIPAMSIRSSRLKSNTQSATAFRGFGGPQGMMGIERVMDHIAHELKADPLEVRRVNLYPDSGRGEPGVTPYHMKVEDCVINELVGELAQKSGYARRRAETKAFNGQGGPLRKGIALTPVKFGISFTLTHLNQAGALVSVYQDGSITMNHGGTEMGQGLFIKVAQVAARVFGQPVEAVKITATDTAKVPNTSATAASSGSDLNGMAVKNACEEIKGRLVQFLAREHQRPQGEIEFRDGKVFIGGEAHELADVARRAWEGRVPLSATGFYATPKLEWNRVAGRGRPFYYFAYGAAVTEVIIDRLTGESRMLRADILHDAGESLNEAIDRGQVEGGFAQGVGWLTTEELVWDKSGRLATHAPSTYKIPACSDRPETLNVELWRKGSNREDTIYRSKAVGEPPLMLGMSAFYAISDAIASCGDGTRYVSLDAPATPERVLMAVMRQEGKA